MATEAQPDILLFIKSIFGAYRFARQQRFAIYIPDRGGVDNEELIDMDRWARRALKILDEISIGSTAMPAALGMWKGREERTTIVYSFVDKERFFNNILRVRRFLHRFGIEGKQENVLFEYGATAFWIKDYDAAPISSIIDD